MGLSRHLVSAAIAAVALIALVPGAASAAGTHTAADWFASCAGGFPLGDRDIGLGDASIDWSGGVDGATGNVFAVGVSFGDHGAVGGPSARFEGALRHEGTGPLAGDCNLSAGVIASQQYSLRNLSNPTATSAELDITFQISGRFEGDFSKGGARFGLDLYFPTDLDDPLDGPRIPIGNLFCQTAIAFPLECFNTGVDLSGLQTLIVTDGIIFDGTVTGRFDAAIGDPFTLGITTFGGLNLKAGSIGPYELRNDFFDTVTWQVSAVDSNVDLTLVPEPGTGVLLATGLLGFTAARRRRA